MTRACKPQCFESWTCVCWGARTNDVSPDGKRVRVSLFAADAGTGALNLQDGAPPKMNQDRRREIAEARREAAFDHYVEQVGLAWQGDQASTAAPRDAAAEYARMARRMSGAWQSE